MVDLVQGIARYPCKAINYTGPPRITRLGLSCDLLSVYFLRPPLPSLQR